MTFEAAFNKIKEKFANVDPAMLEDMAIQITISDEDCGGTFYVEVKNNVLNVEPYDYKDNNVIVDAEKAALYSILDGKQTIDSVIEKGTMTVMGDLQKIEGFQKAIKAPAKKAEPKKTETKAPAKKAPAKKTEAKAPAKKAPAKKAEIKKTEVKTPVKKETVVKKTTK